MAVGALALVVLAGTACSDDDGGDLASFCAAVEDPARFDGVLDGLDPTDVDAARTAFEEARDEQRALRDVAPQAARGDVDILIAFVDDLVEGLAPDAAVDDQGRPIVYQSLQPRFGEVEAAGSRLRVYVESSC